MNTSQKNTTPNDYAAFVGIDWADQKHAYCLQVTGQSTQEAGTLEQKPEAIGPWVAKLCERFGGRRIAVGVEQSRGALIHALMSYEFIVIYPLHPSTAAKFREAFRSSGAKSDPLDAHDILEILTKHLDRLKPLEPDTEETRLLGRLVEDRRKAVELRAHHIQALKAALKEYYPQALELCSGNVTSRFSADLFKRWPSMEALQQAKPATLKKFYYGHNIRSPKVLQEALQLAEHAKVLTTDPAIVESGSRLTLMYSELIQALNRIIAAYDQRIREVFAAHPEVSLFEGLPGGGSVMAPRLLAFFGTDRSRFESAKNVASFTGIAPVTQSSGRTHVVYARRACPKFDRQTFHEFARVSVPYCSWAQNYVHYYTTVKGKGYHTAVRALAFKWIRVLFRCWKTRTPYDDAKYMKALKKSGSRFATVSLEKKS